MSDTLSKWEAEAEYYEEASDQHTPNSVVFSKRILALIELIRKKDHCLRQVLTSVVIFREIPREQAVDIEKALALTEQIK